MKSMDREPTDLLDLFRDPVAAGRLASQRRASLFGDRVAVVGTPALPPDPHPALLLRRNDVVSCPRWPTPTDLEHGDGVVLDIPATPAEQRTWVDYLLALRDRAATVDLSVAPSCTEGASLHLLWAIAVARLVLESRHRVHARHDRLGLRLAQIALGFGADTLSGPLAPERTLPLAGITRPNEHSFTALCTLVRQVGLSTPPREASPQVQS